MVTEMTTVSVDLDDVAVVVDVVAVVEDLKVISNTSTDQTTNKMAQRKSQIRIARRDVDARPEVVAAADVMTVDAVAVDKAVTKAVANKVTVDAVRDRDVQGQIGMIDKKAREDVDADLQIVTGMIDPKRMRTSQK